MRNLRDNKMPPCIPCQIYGKIWIDGNPAPVGTKLELLLDGKKSWFCAPHGVEEWEYITGEEGRYGYTPKLCFICDPNCNRSGKKIELLINGEKNAGGRYKIFVTGGHPLFSVWIGEPAPPIEGKADIMWLKYPEQAQAGESVPITFSVYNRAFEDTLFYELIDNNTGNVLLSDSKYIDEGGEWRKAGGNITMPNKNLNLKLNAGHVVSKGPF